MPSYKRPVINQNNIGLAAVGHPYSPCKEGMLKTVLFPYIISPRAINSKKTLNDRRSRHEKKPRPKSANRISLRTGYQVCPATLHARSQPARNSHQQSDNRVLTLPRVKCWVLFPFASCQSREIRYAGSPFVPRTKVRPVAEVLEFGRNISCELALLYSDGENGSLHVILVQSFWLFMTFRFVSALSVR